MSEDQPEAPSTVTVFETELLDRLVRIEELLKQVLERLPPPPERGLGH